MKAMASTKREKTSIQPQWEEIFAALGDGILILDPQGHIMGVNPEAERINGLPAESLVGLPLEEAFFQNRAALQVIRPALGEVRTTIFREVEWKGREGKTAVIDLSMTPLVGDGGELGGWILALRDQTPIKRLEEEVRKGDRLAMMGTIAAGLAHEIKNPLGGIKGAAQLLLREAPQKSRELLEIIVKETDRVDQLVNQLLTFSRPKALNLEPLNLNQLLDSILLLQQLPMKEEKIRLVREFDPSLPLILGDANELSQVFLNFIKNAIEAVLEKPGNGEKRKILVRSRLVTDFKIKKADGDRASRMVMAEVHDNGIGIPPENLKSVFTPFFTTKEKGYGLGLAIAQRVIHEHGGAVRIRNDHGSGTQVQVFLKSV